MTDLVTMGGDEHLPAHRIRKVIETFWAGKSKKTIRAYQANLQRIATWLKLPSIDEFSKFFLSRGPGDANMLAEEFKGWAWKEKKWAPAYVNNHLAALRSLVKFSRKAGMIVWALDVSDVRVETYRDTRGPGFDGLVKLIQSAGENENKITASRDSAIMWLFASRGLRKDEVVSLDLEHVVIDGRDAGLWVKRKKKSERVWVSIPQEAREALEAWIEHRGKKPGPLFKSYAIAGRREGERLAESSVSWLVHELAKRAGLENAWPHGLRHAAITAILDLTDGNIRGAQHFAGHENPSVTMRYDDNRKDVPGEMATILSKALAAKLKEKGEKK